MICDDRRSGDAEGGSYSVSVCVCRRESRERGAWQALAIMPSGLQIFGNDVPRMSPTTSARRGRRWRRSQRRGQDVPK